MATKSKAMGLGRGLSALLDDAADVGTAPDKSTTTLPVAYLTPNPYQPRQRFDEEALAELTASIREKGLLQPILVRPVGDTGSYEIVAGERRWRAAQTAGLHEVPVVIRALSDGQALELAIVENVQRRDLSPVEEARGYRRLMDEFSHTQEAVAEMVGKSRSHIANLLRLLGLPQPVLELIDGGGLSMGHARALIGADDPAGLARLVTAKGLSVRQTEAMAQTAKTARSTRPRQPRAQVAKDADTRALERDLSAALGLSVDIRHKGQAGGTITFNYTTLDQLDDLCQRLFQA